MNTINKERLLTLADRLDTVPPHDFSLGKWVERPADSKCGFAGCAVGWAGTIDEFNRDGFKFGPGGFHVVYGQSQNWRAVTEFFGLEFHQAEYLFDVGRYLNGRHTTPGEVASRIRAAVA
jgi:hypothetical protein